MAKSTRGKSSTSIVHEADSYNGAAAKPKQKRSRSEDVEKASSCRRMPKRAAACLDFKEKSFRLSEKSSLVQSKREEIVDHEIAALGLTSGQDDPDSRPNRKLKDFTFHDAAGNLQVIEMLEVDELFITGVILTLQENSSEKKEIGVRCEGFGKVLSWSISGYEEGSPVIWVSTEFADYECTKPSTKYRNLYNLFYEKAHACVETYKTLSSSFGGNPVLSLDELIAGVVRSMSSSKNFPHQMSIKEFIISHGEFIYKELIGLDATSKKNGEVFKNLPVLVALRDEKKKDVYSATSEATTSGNFSRTSVKTAGELSNQSSSTSYMGEEVKDLKLARLLQEEEKWLSMNKRDRQHVVTSANVYIKIDEDEIACDYPLPSYYTTAMEETDEFLAVYNDGHYELPEHILEDWTLYDSDARLVSLELLPMKPCADIVGTIFGSGMVTVGGNECCINLDSNQSSSSSTVEQNAGGLPIYLSAIKEWTIDYGSSMIIVSIRTDMSWYKLGKPSKQYAPWYKPIIKTVRLGASIINFLKEQARVARLSFADVIRRVSEFDKKHPAFISSSPAAVQRYVLVHGQIILQEFAAYPDKAINSCPFINSLCDKMKERHHTTLRVNKKRAVKKEMNFNPREAVTTTVSRRKEAMPATTTRLINRIWGEYYSNYLPEDLKGAYCPEEKEDVEAEQESEENEKDEKENDEVEEEQEENGQEESDDVEDLKMQVQEKAETPQSGAKGTKSQCSYQDIRWDGGLLSRTCTSNALYEQAVVHGDIVAVGNFVLVETEGNAGFPSIYYVEYMFESLDTRKMIHGRLLVRGVQTVLGNAANKREVFLTNDCLEFELIDVKQTVVVEIRRTPWGYQHWKDNIYKDKIDREKAEERKSHGLPMEYYCKSLYWPEKGAFFTLPRETMGLGTGHCHSCRLKEVQREKEGFKLNFHGNGFTYKGTEYYIHEFVYLASRHFPAVVHGMDHEIFKGGKNVGLRPYAVSQLMEIESCQASEQASPEVAVVKIRRFFRPEDISTEKAYCSDIREVYCSEKIVRVPIMAIEGKCEVRKKDDLPLLDSPAIFEHIFFCENMYDPDNGGFKQLPAHIKLSSSKERMVDELAYRNKKGKCIEGENDFSELGKEPEALFKNRLATLDIFAGCGGLSEGLEKAGASLTKWAIEYEEPAGEAFKLNHPEALVFINNCNVILRAIMSACGDADECISTEEANELAEKLDYKEIKNLPRPGEVEFVNGGPPCQGFSGMNRFSQGAWSKVQCEMILAFLSFADYFRPKFFLLENVRNFVSFNKGKPFRLTLASLLEMGYQVRFGVLEAGAYGVSQSRKRAFIWAASPEETLPEWPEPMHVFAGPELKVTLSKNSQYAAVQSTANGAPFRAITVKDTIRDLPVVANGASSTVMEYENEPVSWFQKTIRGDTTILMDHISKEMNELNLIRCKRIPKRPGADWRDLPNENVRLSTGQVVNLVPWCLPNTAERHNQWKGLFGRLDWEGNFPTSVTDPQPMGKVGMCFHPQQDRIITVREYARSQGFSDSYKFYGSIQHKHRQIGNAVPPPLAFALGRKLKEAIAMKNSST